MSDPLVLHPDLQALIDDLAEEGRTAFERECDDCGRRFIPKQAWGRFCSSRCRLRAWRKARREEAVREHIGDHSCPGW
jgi:hypothetical protein